MHACASSCYSALWFECGGLGGGDLGEMGGVCGEVKNPSGALSLIRKRAAVVRATVRPCHLPMPVIVTVLPLSLRIVFSVVCMIPSAKTVYARRGGEGGMSVV